MFGKNKKTKKKESSSQAVVHTMQDDLNIDLEESSEDINLMGAGIAKKSSLGDDKKHIEKNKKDSIFSHLKEKKEDLKSEMNSAQSVGAGKSPFLADASSNNDLKSSNSYSGLKTSPAPAPESKPVSNPVPKPTPKPKSIPKPTPVPRPTPKPEVTSPTTKPMSTPDTTPKSNLNTNTPSVMPKSVNNLTTAVGKKEYPLSNDKSVSNPMSDKLIDDDLGLEGAEEGKKPRVFAYVAIIILIILVGVAGYFIWNSKHNIDLSSINLRENGINLNIFTEEPNIIVDGSESVTETEVSEEIVKFSEKANFLAVSSSDLSKEGLENILNKKFTEMGNADKSILEFVMVDENNESIKFTEFANAFGLGLSVDTLGKLGDDFSIYLHKNGVDNRVSLSIKIVDSSLLMTSLKTEEASLTKEMQPLFLGSVGEDVLIGNTFNDSLYGDIDIRFTNINNSNSVDYAKVGDYLVIATNKDNGRKIIDRLLLEEAEVANEGLNLETSEIIESNDGVIADIFDEDDMSEGMDSEETIIEVE